MNKLIVSLLLTVGISGIAHAAGDAAAGQAKAAVCGACHGPDGNSMAPNFPKLAGQGERYLTKQLHDIKSGKGDRCIQDDFLISLPGSAPGTFRYLD